eukprot:NODE_152_length_15391_cov_0.883272.p2 type:complete len:391 gc:universal NODE_152_length_15391_cov_0.883272:2952-4124(+)
MLLLLIHVISYLAPTPATLLPDLIDKSKKTIVIELLDTLLFIKNSPIPNPNTHLVIIFENKPIYVYVRTYAMHLIKTAYKSNYEIVIFTRLSKVKALQLMQRLEIQKHVHHLLAQESLTSYNNFDGSTSLIKDYSRLNRNMKNVLILDNQPNALTNYPVNMIIVPSYTMINNTDSILNDYANALNKTIPYIVELFRKIVVFDLDDTLFHAQQIEEQDYNPNNSHHIKDGDYYVNVRPDAIHLIEAAYALNYKIVVFTAAEQTYADQMIELIDPNHRIHHRLYRDSCYINESGNFIKNLSELKKLDIFVDSMYNNVIMFDDNPWTLSTNSNNVVLVPPYSVSLIEGKKDRILQVYIQLLKMIVSSRESIPSLLKRYKIVPRSKINSNLLSK